MQVGNLRTGIMSKNVKMDGITPNPDVRYNREIKLGALLEHLPYKDTKKPPISRILVHLLPD
ncbi:hypothetical protein B0H19DRAFT_1189961 [Mycena capillaripes]|nr:hypothetical protein B0H19DRAFT_1189961 [Mycena capillaripes]